MGECLQCASVTLLCSAGRWRGDTEGERGRTGDEVHGAYAVFVVVFGRKYWFLCSRAKFALFFGDDHGGEAVVDRRDTYWASGWSAVTNSLLLSVLWAVGMFGADRNVQHWVEPRRSASAGVGNSTIFDTSCVWSIKIINKLYNCSLICCWLVRTILAADGDKGRRFGHHCCRRTSPNSIKHRGQ
jgi:hypothetical protein